MISIVWNYVHVKWTTVGVLCHKWHMMLGAERFLRSVICNHPRFYSNRAFLVTLRCAVSKDNRSALQVTGIGSLSTRCAARLCSQQQQQNLAAVCTRCWRLWKSWSFRPPNGSSFVHNVFAKHKNSTEFVVQYPIDVIPLATLANWSNATQPIAFHHIGLYTCWRIDLRLFHIEVSGC